MSGNARVKVAGDSRRRRRAARRGYALQHERRQAECAAKNQAVECVRYAVLQGGRKQALAEELGIAPRTLRDWERLGRKGDLRPRRRGRPPKRSSAESRNALLELVAIHGPGIGVRTLRSLLPGLGREEVRAILARYREHYMREHAVVLGALEWLRPGMVWALDHTVPGDGRKQTIISLRDLASGAQLLWEIQAGPRARDTVRALERLFVLHGPPLVLKCDNGSAFISAKFQALCERWGVEILWSPPRRPSYNGAIESSIRWMKMRTAHAAARAGRPGEWRREDLCEALKLVNRLPKDAERSGTPRWEVFSGRWPIGKAERAGFRATLATERSAARRASGIVPGTTIGRQQWAEIQRQAMRRALVALGYLTITTRRVPLTLKSVLAARIS